MTKRDRSRNAGFTLLEVLVSIGIVALLVALILPAVQNSRETARKMHCASNLKQLGLGVAQYQTVHGVFPDAMNYRMSLLPFIEQPQLSGKLNYAGTTEEEVWRAIADVRIPVYRCPSESAPETFLRGSQRVSSANYAGCLGTWMPANGFDGLIIPFLANYYPNDYPSLALRPESVRKGLSQTALMSELLCADGAYARMRTIWLLPAPAPFASPDDMNLLGSACSSIPLDPIGTDEFWIRWGQLDSRRSLVWW